MSLAQLVRAIVRDFRFERSYPATVERMNADGTVDVLPDDDAMRGLGMQRLPVHVGLPSAAVRAEQGARCLVSFAGGDPRKPHVSAWEFRKASATLFFDGGVAAVARKGDLVEVLLGPTTPIAGALVGTVTVPGSPPTTVPVAPGTAFSGQATIVAPARGVIVGGAQRVKA